MAEKKGVARLRRAIENQAALGEVTFSLPDDEACALLRECEDELARLAWANGVPAPVDADGEVVPLDTKVMYTGFGDEITLKRFMFYYSNFRKCFVWHVANQDSAVFSLNILHLTCPDSWEKLEEDVARIGSADDPCDYFNHADCGMPCCSCPAHTDAEDCTAGLARDVLRRAKALAERDAKGLAPQPSLHGANEADCD